MLAEQKVGFKGPSKNKLSPVPFPQIGEPLGDFLRWVQDMDQCSWEHWVLHICSH